MAGNAAPLGDLARCILLAGARVRLRNRSYGLFITVIRWELPRTNRLVTSCLFRLRLELIDGTFLLRQ